MDYYGKVFWILLVSAALHSYIWISLQGLH